jgi:hypothetical protein
VAVLLIDSDHPTDETVLRLDSEVRRQVADILADWLSIYAGVHPAALTREKFDLVVELRRVLLSPDEGQ